MATNETPKETDEVMVSGNLISTREFDRVKSAVCLLKPGPDDTRNSWRGSGFYVHLKFTTKDKKKKKKVGSIYCIMTNHHVFQMAENTNKMVAVFNHEGGDEIPVEVPLEPFEIIAKSKELDYALIRLEEKRMTSLGFQPIEADGRHVPRIDDSVSIIQHPRGKEKHFSTDRIRRITPPFIEYFADTQRGSSGSPVLLAVGSRYVLVALHCKGVELPPEYWNKGVLISEILYHLNTGKCAHPGTALAQGTPGQLESAAHVPTGSNKDNLVVSSEDVRYLANDVVGCWQPLGRELGLLNNEITMINLDYQNSVYEKSYQMLTKWKQKKVKDATYGALAKALQHPSVDRPDLVAKYCTAKNIQ